MTSRRLLAAALLALAVLYAAWFANDRHAFAALLVFALPPLALVVPAWRGWPRIGFAAGVLALLWFSHGVMLAWSDPAQRLLALVEVALALVVVYASSIDGVRARFGRRR